MREKEKVKFLLKFLHRLYGYSNKKKNNPFLVLISTLLSQRTRDETTDAATERIFSVYNTPKEFSDAPLEELENLIKPVGFYHVKAKRIKQISSILIDRFNGIVPNNIEELLTLPGVGRKTANCVLVFGFDIPALPVDTHVHRISNRLGLVKTKEPYKTEIELTKIAPIEELYFLNTFMVKFGREICKPIGPRCYDCGVRDACDYFEREKN